jgi:2-hydroxycyclohexanecarboxyl-CoA dehydrogenase
MRLEGRTGFVTGGASGIGAATALRLASEGARVVVADIDADGAGKVAAEVGGDWVEVDVADVASVRAAIDAAVRTAGAIDILVNNAGTDRFAFFGILGFTKAIAREGARYGVRCNAVAPGPIETPLLNAAVEESGALGSRLRQGMIDATVMARPGTPEEVAGAIAFLASDDASFVTGHTLAVSGGLSML